MTDTATLYAARSPSDLEPFYSRHVGAMTREGLHAKADIAAELAWRDAEIARLRAALEPLAKLLRSIDSDQDDRIVESWLLTNGDIRRAARAFGGDR